jgi:hypothetical protein
MIFSSKFAWWYLSRRQKEALKEKRAEGQYGGVPPKAPYFWQQEYGKAEVGIEAQHFAEKACLAMDGELAVICDYHLEGLL